MTKFLSDDARRRALEPSEHRTAVWKWEEKAKRADLTCLRGGKLKFQSARDKQSLRKLTRDMIEMSFSCFFLPAPERREFLRDVEELLRGEIGKEVYLDTMRVCLCDFVMRHQLDDVLKTPFMERMHAEVGAVSDRALEIDYYDVFFGGQSLMAAFKRLLTGKFISLDTTYVHESLCNAVDDPSIYEMRPPVLNVDVFEEFLHKYKQALRGEQERGRTRDAFGLARKSWEETMRFLVARFPTGIIFREVHLEYLALAHACKILADRRLMAEQASARNAYDLIFSQDCNQAPSGLFFFVGSRTSLTAHRIFHGAQVNRSAEGAA
ncbi:Hypothetical Protein FCC1311_113902 [Hondaea fermentalgiana]|uniref:Uncharacterized protein n=1 Tax=Hondaea fermentalgiana TaxID=2315210 RepID=A0A2R5GWG2_9STRA|nr:Hypothetical Protein FCC1311_113902 [Hondaea fermentalgiana]|eukprot:GBG35167.1 Hypothetical Protein FCC1311_113902 [Hondaea fermentalgiana]